MSNIESRMMKASAARGATAPDVFVRGKTPAMPPEALAVTSTFDIRRSTFDIPPEVFG
jgi:hypothetical protein